VRLSRVLLVLAAAAAAGGAAAERGDAPFVVSYRCDGGRLLAVGYPAYRDAKRVPIRVEWQGRTIELAPARAGSGARYISVSADLEWWSKGNGGDLYRLSKHQPLLTGCVEV
jgi:membrane-bound inhibitor of C-type lysozyme